LILELFLLGYVFDVFHKSFTQKTDSCGLWNRPTEVASDETLNKIQIRDMGSKVPTTSSGATVRICGAAKG